MNNSFIRLFSSCIPVKGYNRSIIIDTWNNKYYLIPNLLYENITRKWKKIPFECISKTELNKEYIDFLLTNNLAYLFRENEIENFLKLSLAWDYPARITNAIIDIDELDIDNIKMFINQLLGLGCCYVQIRIFKNLGIQEVEEIIKIVNCKSCIIIQIIMPYTNEEFKEKIIDFFQKYAIIHYVVLCNSLENKSIEIDPLRSIILTKQKIDSKNICGNIEFESISGNCNKTYVLESINYNSCLNRKISIDIEGNIKNCPSMNCSFGNVKDTTLEEAINKPGFKDLWIVKKDNIDVCRDCEFRYMCPDCRCFIKDQNNIYSQPAKCNYNPYISKWKGEEGYISVEECGSYSEENRYISDKRKINKYNKQLWGE